MRTIPSSDRLLPLRIEIARLRRAGSGLASLTRYLWMDPGRGRGSVLLDPTKSCHLRCRIRHPTGHRSQHCAGDEWSQAVSREVQPLAHDISFGCRHEPLMDPDLPRHIRTLRSKRYRQASRPEPCLLTSGSQLTPEFRETLAAAGLDTLLLSIDTTVPDDLRLTSASVHLAKTPKEPGPLPATRAVESAPGGCSGSHHVDNVAVSGYHSSEDRRSGHLPHASFPTRGGSAGRSEPHRAVPGHGRRGASNRPDQIEDRGEATQRHGDSSRASASFSPEGTGGPADGRWDVQDEELLKNQWPVVWTAPWYKVRVDSRGFVFPCQRMVHPQDALGNLLEHPLTNLLSGEMARNLKSGLLAGRSPSPVCRRCSFGPRKNEAC